MTVKMAMKTNQCYPRYGYDSKESNQDRGLHMCDPLVETPEKHGRLLELLMLLFSCGKISYTQCLLYAKNHLLFTHEPCSSCGPANEKSGSKAGLQVWSTAEHLFSIVRLRVQPLVHVPQRETHDLGLLYSDPLWCQTLLRPSSEAEDSFCLVCRRLWV